jgi:hypothetical protein
MGEKIINKNIFQEYFDCSDCPCKNTDYEYGDSCNLGCDVTYVWNMCDRRLIAGSLNCTLILVEWGALKIYQPKKTMATEVRPEKWGENVGQFSKGNKLQPVPLSIPGA